MDTSTHNLPTLFLQLGLSDRPEDIEEFIRIHRPLTADLPLSEARFWTPSQATFLREAIGQDSDWCEVVDELDNRLR